MKHVAHYSTVLRSIEVTKKRIRLMECNGVKREVIDEELRRLRIMRRQLPWVR